MAIRTKNTAHMKTDLNRIVKYLHNSAFNEQIQMQTMTHGKNFSKATKSQLDWRSCDAASFFAIQCIFYTYICNCITLLLSKNSLNIQTHTCKFDRMKLSS